MSMAEKKMIDSILAVANRVSAEKYGYEDLGTGLLINFDHFDYANRSSDHEVGGFVTQGDSVEDLEYALTADKLINIWTEVVKEKNHG